MKHTFDKSMLVKPLIARDCDHYWEGSERGYKTPVGKFPGVTTILSKTKPHNTVISLSAWRERENAKEAGSADAVLTKASSRGTKMHASIEDLFAGKFVENPCPYFESIAPQLKHFSMPLLKEGAVWHPEKGYAGKLDYLGYYKGELAIADWKSADKPKNPAFVIDYMIQAAAYAQAVNWLYKDSLPAPVGSAVIVIGIPGKDAQVFELTADDLETYGWYFDLRLQKFYSDRPKPQIVEPIGAGLHQRHLDRQLVRIGDRLVGID